MGDNTDDTTDVGDAGQEEGGEGAAGTAEMHEREAVAEDSDELFPREDDDADDGAEPEDD